MPDLKAELSQPYTLKQKERQKRERGMDEERKNGLQKKGKKRERERSGKKRESVGSNVVVL